jgi:predicted  nucleic acid-binding Zn-ribbon protein|tara:strand:+ start:349 stop:696 length:348 start_codon:yes stop_codon:yes gene_type:complete
MNLDDIKRYFIYIPVVAALLSSMYYAITTFNQMTNAIESAAREIEMIRKDLSYWDNEMTRTKEDFTREMTRIATELAEGTAYIQAARENGYKIEDTIRQNTYDIKELTRQLNGGW